MKFNQLRFFLAVFEEGSITAAAEREHATQPGVSSHIREMEKSIGATLFERTTTGMQPTAAATYFYPRARAILGQFKSLQADAIAYSGKVTGQVRVGLMPAFARSGVAPSIQNFTEQYPLVNLQVTEAYSGELTERVELGQLDFAIVPSAAVSKKLQAEHYATDTEFLVQSAHAGLPSLQTAHLSKIENLQLIVPGIKNSRRQSIEQYLQRHSIKPQRTLELDTMMATLNLIANSNWSAILPGILCAEDVVAQPGGGSRSVHPLGEGKLTLDYMLIRPAVADINPACERYLEMLRSSTEELLEKITRLIPAAPNS